MSQRLDERAREIAEQFKASGTGIANTAGIARLAEVLAEMAAEVVKLREELDQLKQGAP